jgi:hypothetical protein
MTVKHLGPLHVVIVLLFSPSVYAINVKFKPITDQLKKGHDIGNFVFEPNPIWFACGGIAFVNALAQAPSRGTNTFAKFLLKLG